MSARIDAADYWSEVQSAAMCHRSQVGGNAALRRLDPEDLRVLWGTQQFYRALSTLHTGDVIETDLFAGLRDRIDEGQVSCEPVMRVMRQD